MVPYGARYNWQHCILHAFEQFGALYMPNSDANIRPAGRDSSSEPAIYCSITYCSSKTKTNSNYLLLKYVVTVVFIYTTEKKQVLS